MHPIVTRLSHALLACMLWIAVAGAQERSASPPGAEAYFVDLKDHAVVRGPLTLHFGLKGMGVAPAGVALENTGHFHLLIDTPLPADLAQPIPTVDGKVVHFGKGQTETTVSLAPGTHTVQLLLGDAKHVPHQPAVASSVVHVTVRP